MVKPAVPTLRASDTFMALKCFSSIFNYLYIDQRLDLKAQDVEVWAALARWFFVYRCNHIFQAACGKLWVQVIRHGSVQLQQHIFQHLRLFSSLCDAILTEGLCGDRWHEVKPRARYEDGRVEKQQELRT